MEKLHEYQGWSGRFHQWREEVKERSSNIRSNSSGNILDIVKNAVEQQMKGNITTDQDFSHIYRYLVHVKNFITMQIITSIKYCNPFFF